VHLWDPATASFNRPFCDDGLELLAGWRRRIGIVTRPSEDLQLERITADSELRMVNRNRGSGTRALIEELLGDLRPNGWTTEPRSHQAVAAAVAQGRADWGVCTDVVARSAGLDFRELRLESYDFVVPAQRMKRREVRLLAELLAPGSALWAELEAAGFLRPEDPGSSDGLT